MAYADRPSPLARYLLVAYALLIAYASLNPFAGWREPGISLFAFLVAPMPRYIDSIDIIANIAAYFPMGLLLILALHPRWRGLHALVIAMLATVAMSFSLEALQHYLPSRIPSNLDLLANSLGGLIGAVAGSGLANRLLRDNGLQAVCYRLFRDGARIDFGMMLLGLWLVSLLYPGTSLFGNGDLRAVFSEPGAELHPTELFIRFEALIVGANTVAVGLLLALLIERNQPVRGLFLALLVAALCVRSISYGLLFSSQRFFDWLTPGASLGLVGGVLLVMVMVMFSRGALVVLCGVALMTATALVNYAPVNPYFLAALSIWNQGHFLNFNGFTRVLSAAWPFAALIYILALSVSRNRDRD
ncbi:MAG: VanZ family protein [Burkholderiales bacterium]